MDTLVHADIFFFITAIATVVIAAILAIALVYLVRILKNARYISDKLKVASDDLEKDFQDLRKNAREEGSKVKHLLSLIKAPAKRGKAKKAEKAESK